MKSDSISRSVRVAMIQLQVEGARPQENLLRAAKRIDEAAEGGAEIALLPECLDFGWTDPSAVDSAHSIPGSHFEVLAAAASKAKIHIVAGLVERAGEKLFNSAVVIGPSGELLGLHRKINELSMARDLYSVGDRLAVFDTELGRLGVNICADNLPASLVLGHSLAHMGAELILSPSAWAVDADHDNRREPYEPFWMTPYRELATTNHLTVIGVSSVGWISSGPWRGRQMIGCSLAVGPDGHVLAQAPYGVDAECITMVEVESAPA